MARMLVLLLLLGGGLVAQTAEGYYHQGAQLYIDARLGDAIAAVERGLQLDPGNPKLQALMEKLQEEQEKQQQQQQQ
ncbi:MAG: hypothetical protein KDH84_12245, partial [Calditrichaeota bacterium]|nr:hypothetical protein [Calditrichota bacterium]